MFRLQETKDKCLQFGVSIQRNLYEESYKISPSILIESPFAKTPRRGLLVLGNLRKDGIYLHERTESWWPPESLPDALISLKSYFLPWFEQWRNPGLLLERLETSIEKRMALMDVIEPLSAEQESALQRAWPQVKDNEQRVPVLSYFAASILHHLVGNKEMAIQRTEDWFNRLSPNDQAERHEAMEQLSMLRRLGTVR